jgi:hypothetical protein
VILIDPAVWPAHGRWWSHLISDVSFDELHAFAERAGIPRRAFDGDHYDIPADRLAHVVEAGATPVDGRELLGRLLASGLRRRKGHSDRVGQHRVGQHRVGQHGGVQLVAASTGPLGDAGE